MFFRRKININIKYSVLVLFFALTTTISILNPVVARADGQDGSVISQQISGQILDHQLYYFLLSCAAQVDVDKVTKDEINSWEFFTRAEEVHIAARGGMYDVPLSACSLFGTTSQESSQFLAEAWGRFGFTDPLNTFCSLSFTYNRQTGGLGKTVNDGNTKEACINGVDSGDFDGAGSTAGQVAAIEKLLATTEKGRNARLPLNNSQEYVRYYRTLMNGCDVTLKEKITDINKAGGSNDPNNQLYAIPVVVRDDKGVASVEYWLGQSPAKNDGDKKVPLVATTSGDADKSVQYKTCNELATALRGGYATAYTAYINGPGKNDTFDIVGGSDTDKDKDATTCAIDNIGWILCPVMKVMGSVVDAAYDVIRNLLTVQPILTTGTSKTLYDSWSLMRNFANVAFALVFLIIIYSQITGTGVSNYGIKRMLPRLVIAAILVNASYWICAAAVDVSNIAGTALKGFFDNAQLSIDSPNFDATGNTGTKTDGGAKLSGQGWVGLTAVAIVLTGAALWITISALLPALVIALFAIVTVFLVLTLRQALIILLIVISPLAFVAFLLPNTEEWFKKWRGLFQTLLLMFPIIAVIFGASAMASKIIMGSSTTFAVQIMGALVSILPLAITPVVMKTAGGVLNRFGGFINNPNKGPFDRMRKGAEGYRDKRQDIAKTRRLNGTSMFGTPGSKLRKSDNRFARGVGRVIGAPTDASSGLAGRALTKERQAASAKSAAEFAEQNYVATRAENEASGYAKKIAGPTGSASLAQAYAIETIEKEKAKDRAAEKTIFEHNGTSFEDLGEGIRNGAFTGAREEAAVQRYFETANSKGVQEMLEHINSVRSDPSLDESNPNLNKKALDRAKELTKITGEALANSPLKPVNLSASNNGKLRNGEAVPDEAARITSTVAEGKVNANSIGKMDIDEIRKWTEKMSSNGSLLAGADPSKIAATRQAIIDAEADPRINVNFGERETEGLAQLKAQLEAQLAVANSPVGQKARQDAAASTYGPDI